MRMISLSAQKCSVVAGDTIAIKANAAGTPATPRTYTLSLSSSRRAWVVTTRDPTPASLNISVVSGNASAMNVAYTASTSYGSAVRFRVDNAGESPSAAMDASQLSNMTNFEFHTAGVGDGCSGQVIAGGSNCIIDVRPLATGSSPISGTLTVTDGVTNDAIALSGAATGWPCPRPWGGTVAAGDSITAYSATSVPCGSACASVSQTRTCSATTGSLSGSFTNQNCTPVVCANCTVPAGTTWTVSGQICTVPTTLNIGHGSTGMASDGSCPRPVRSRIPAPTA
jgi:hypothetical protein